MRSWPWSLYQGVANATPMLGCPACTGVKTPAYHHLAANAALAKANSCRTFADPDEFLKLH